MNYGKLYLIPTTLGETEPLNVLPTAVQSTIYAIDEFIVENEKTARRFIKNICPEKSQPSLKLHIINKYTELAELPEFLSNCLKGTDVGIISEAGCPGVADPGADVVKIAHQKGIQVIPLVGPSSILLAMMSSGFNGQNFAFNGYLPIDKGEKKNALKTLERRSKELQQSQIFIETPYRNNQLLESMCGILQNNTQLCVACDITLSTEYIKTQSIGSWKKTKVDLHKRPAIFILHQF
ncbi:S-adenosylmethionine-dependent methyltransferase [Neptunitalea chrysea]|uniref:S-adenosylmethionine-dependent methyltransferase n=1 Tax=Neptunitalea chrysea TaxID=1647581 RepID=A0A9W6B5Q5_9FLAO|nr:SAM-dependent methyltransferase [Neptunitalea chrysea]GLB51193.1 S-adenosylmethionine-dependent methyltransferase [Neptunitalea chrysea]